MIFINVWVFVTYTPLSPDKYGVNFNVAGKSVRR
jgi:hypothetical protein